MNDRTKLDHSEQPCGAVDVVLDDRSQRYSTLLFPVYPLDLPIHIHGVVRDRNKLDHNEQPCGAIDVVLDDRS